VRVSGEIDMATAPILWGCLEGLWGCLAGLDGQAVTLDFSAVTFMDTSGVNVLVSAVRRARDGGGVAPVLRGVQPRQMLVVELTRVAELLTFDDNGS